MIKRFILGAGIVGLAVAIAFTVADFDSFRHWWAIHTGINSPDPVWYNFWSGFGSDLGEATLVISVTVGVVTGVRKVNCHTKGCWRIGHHPLRNTPYHLCRKHHPEVPTEGATHEHIMKEHNRVNKPPRRARATEK